LPALQRAAEGSADFWRRLLRLRRLWRSRSDHRVVAQTLHARKRPRAQILTAQRPRNRGNRSPRFLEYQWSLMLREEQRKPWTTWLLSAAIICASLLAFANLREIVQRFGLIPAQATRLHGLTFITSFF